tara:strand:+ start:3789 stop:4232 length:444 start_codon:yes stop_codon:yes gene_type:complete
MLSFIRSLPFVGITLLFAYGAHSFIVGNLNKTVEQQQMQIDVLNQRNVALESAAQINEQTIRSLEESNSKQIEQIGDLQVANTEYQRQAEEAMAIFRDHDLTILSRRRPNMIEDRANDATKAVFDAVEQDSRDISQLDEQKDEENSN